MQPYISIIVPTNCYATKLLCVSSRENVSSAGVTLLTAVVTVDQPVDTRRTCPRLEASSRRTSFLATRTARKGSSPKVPVLVGENGAGVEPEDEDDQPHVPVGRFSTGLWTSGLDRPSL
jgi:hypothetical protein